MYIQLFETYKAQKEIEKLADRIIKKIAERTYLINHEKYGKKLDLSGKFWKGSNFDPFELMNVKIRFKETIPGFTKHGIYMINFADNEIFKVAGYNHEFKYGDVDIIWDESNLITYNGEIYTVSLSDIDNEYDELRDFCDNFNLNIRYKIKETNYNSDKGYFKPMRRYDSNVGEIVLYTNRDIVTHIREKAKEQKELSLLIIYTELFSRGYKTLLHELQHAYDYYRSGGRSMDSQYKDDKYHKDIDVRDEIYSDKSKSEFDINKELSEKEIEFLGELVKI